MNTRNLPINRVSGKVVLISGAAQGMGASHAKTLASEGARVVVADIQKQPARDLVSEINHASGDEIAVYCELDVTSFKSWTETVETTIDAFGKLDGLINNAGIFTPGNAEKATLEDWNRTIEIDLTGTYLGMKASIPYLRKQGHSSIVNVSSIAGLTGFKDRAAYSAAKWGVLGLTKTSAMDFAADGIRVNSIHPGSIETPLNAHLERGFGQIPLGHPGDVRDVSSLVLFLISDESRFITGASIAIDGGETAGNHLRQTS
ncbi:SDR family NAD(P)-dependent oxidoreductase [Micrococcoides hystricis]|uniref:SDR family NAD(P)-dependent oxidoreductase n=1 Tax=Micrococcoides hystricis TaxID=1572761 RepID=A0ABV6PCJ7_9MICC